MRIANATRYDVSQLHADAFEAESEYVHQAHACNRPVQDCERFMLRLERLWAFEDEWEARSAQEGRMMPEWSGGAPT